MSASFIAVESFFAVLFAALALGAGVHVLLDPRQDRLQHLAVVLLDHHHVAVAVDVVSHEPQFFGAAAGLFEIGDRAGIAG